MIKHENIVQGSLEWFEIKWGKIGGTLSKGLFVNSDTLLIDILSQRLEDFEPSDSFTNEAMERGNDLEPFARQYLESYKGLKFNQYGWLQSEKNELIGISPDGLTECETKACEIKCFGRKKHYEILLNGEIPLENIPQLLHYFTVNPKLISLYFIAFRPEAPNHFIKEIKLDTLINMGTKAKPIIKSVETFRDYSLEKSNELLTDIMAKECILKQL